MNVDRNADREIEVQLAKGFDSP